MVPLQHQLMPNSMLYPLLIKRNLYLEASIVYSLSCARPAAKLVPEPSRIQNSLLTLSVTIQVAFHWEH